MENIRELKNIAGLPDSGEGFFDGVAENNGLRVVCCEAGNLGLRLSVFLRGVRVEGLTDDTVEELMLAFGAVPRAVAV